MKRTLHFGIVTTAIGLFLVLGSLMVAVLDFIGYYGYPKDFLKAPFLGRGSEQIELGIQGSQLFHCLIGGLIFFPLGLLERLRTRLRKHEREPAIARSAREQVAIEENRGSGDIDRAIEAGMKLLRKAERQERKEDPENVLNRRYLVVGFAIVGLGFTEYLFAVGMNSYGILTAIASTLALYGLISLVKMDDGVAKVVEIVCLLLLYVLLISMLPWFYIKQEYLFPAVYMILIGLCVWYMSDAGLSLADVGARLPQRKIIPIVGSLFGVLTGVIEYQILKPPPALPYLTVSYVLQTVVTMTLFVGVGEELLFRGILLTNLEKSFSPRSALVVSSMMFAILHFTWRIVSEIAFVFLIGLILGYIFQRTESLIPPIAIHAINNIILVAVLPFF